MFRDDYKKEMDSVVPSEKSLAKAREASRRAGNRRVSAGKTVHLRRYSGVAAAAAVFLVVCLCSAFFGQGFDIGGPVNRGNQVYKPIKNFTSAADYKEIFTRFNDIIGKGFNRFGDAYYTAEGSVSLSDALGMSKGETAGDSYAPKDNTATNDYSDTNLQVLGVQESDIIKTDGKYIYAVSDTKINIISAVNGKLALVSTLDRETVCDSDAAQSISAFEIYLNGDRLIVLSRRNTYHDADGELWKGKDLTADSIITSKYGYYRSFSVVVHVYDISDRKNPVQESVFTQDGYYLTSRMIGSQLYLLTSKHVYTYDEDDIGSYVPEVFEGMNIGYVKAEDIYFSDSTASEQVYYYFSNYTVVGSYDSEKGEITDTKAFFGYGNNVYCSLENIYVTSTSYEKASSADEGDSVGSNSHYSSVTNILRIALDGGKIAPAAQTKLPGSLLNQFSMDEYKGAFRLVTTVDSSANGTSNSLYVLDMNLEMTGSITGLAETERVYSVRFDGDTGYFVTFRQTDPLFTVDLSDVTAPKILHALKIPGFSNYLHPYGDGLLFGIGQDADANGATTGFIKLTMFDVSDKTDVTEAHTEVTKINYSSALYNHKRILINSDKNIIAFPGVVYGYSSEEYGYKDFQGYSVYSYTPDGGFKEEAHFTLASGMTWDDACGLFIGDYIYIFCSKGISSYSIADNYNAVSVLNLK